MIDVDIEQKEVLERHLISKHHRTLVNESLFLIQYPGADSGILVRGAWILFFRVMGSAGQRPGEGPGGEDTGSSVFY